MILENEATLMNLLIGAATPFSHTKIRKGREIKLEGIRYDISSSDFRQMEHRVGVARGGRDVPPDKRRRSKGLPSPAWFYQIPPDAFGSAYNNCGG